MKILFTTISGATYEKAFNTLETEKINKNYPTSIYNYLNNNPWIKCDGPHGYIIATRNIEIFYKIDDPPK